MADVGVEILASEGQVPDIMQAGPQDLQDLHQHKIRKAQERRHSCLNIHFAVMKTFKEMNKKSFTQTIVQFFMLSSFLSEVVFIFSAEVVLIFGVM